MTDLKSDLAAALRSLRRAPLLVAGAVLTLGVSVGLNLAMVGLIDRALLSPPSLVIEPDRVFTLSFAAPGEKEGVTGMVSTSFVNFKAIRDHATTVQSAAAFQRTTTTLVTESEQHSVNAMIVSGGYFATLGAQTTLGRALSEQDDKTAAAQSAAILSQFTWRRLFHADPGVIGRRVSIGGLDYVIAGIMAEGFSGHSTASVDLWIPFAGAMRDTPGWDEQTFRNIAGVVVRIAAGSNPSAAASQIGTVIDRGTALSPIGGSETSGSERQIAWWLGGVAILVFAIGLANTATLMVVRGSRVRHAMSVRIALGASRARLIRHAVVEALVLSTIATLVSLVLALWMDEAVRSVLFPGLLTRTGTSPLAWGVALGAVLIATISVAGATVSQLPTHGALVAGRSTVDGRKRVRAINGLLILQTTFAMLLLAGAGFFGTSLYRLWNQDFGLRLNQTLVVDFEPGPAQVTDQNGLFTEALSRVRSLPGVQLATPIDAIPFAGFNVPPISVPGRTEPPAIGQQLPFLTAATPEFFKILGLRIVQGRGFVEADDRSAPVVIVNETMAREVWPGESAIGKCIRIGFNPDFNPQTFDPSNGPPMPGSEVPCRELVGVTRDVRQRSVLPFDGEDRWMQYFVPFSQVPVPSFVQDPTKIRGILLRVSGDSSALTTAIRRLILADRTDLPFLRVRPYSDLLAHQMRPWTIGTRLLGLFSALALCVAAIGLYAAFAHAVAERRHEMAVRLAIGAGPSMVRSMVLGEALRLAVTGAMIGSALAIAAGRIGRTLLFGTEPFDPVVLGGSAAAMLMVAAVATLSPAYRASQADPAVLLRSE